MTIMVVVACSSLTETSAMASSSRVTLLVGSYLHAAYTAVATGATTASMTMSSISTLGVVNVTKKN
jgi:hypothetical protein